MDDPRDRFGSLIREARRTLGMTQEDLAEAVDVTQPTVSGWESGKSIPSLSALNDLAAKLELDAGTLLTAAAAASRVVAA